MKRRAFAVLFLCLVWFESGYSREINTRNSLLMTPVTTFSQVGEEKDSGDVFDIWIPEESGLKYRKSLTKAALLSLILPGTGEYYADSKGKAHIFMGTDAVLWTGFFGLRGYGSWLENDYRIYAAQHAGIDLSGKRDEFFEDLTYYQSRDEYNQFAPLYSNGELGPYPQTNLWDWQWDDTASRQHYRDLRNKSKAAYRKSLFVAALLLANRVASAIDAIKVVRQYNRRKHLEISSLKIGLEANPWASNPYFRLTLTKSF